MTSITTWVRLEPQCRSVDMSAGLQARIYDPLWLLARQWQVGEFQGRTTARLQTLLARLALYPGVPQPRQRLALLLWPDSTDAQARTNEHFVANAPNRQTACDTSFGRL